MEYTLFGTPIHTVLHNLRPYAWVSICCGDISPRDDRRTISTEAIDDNFSIMITSELLQNEAGYYILRSIIFIVLIGISSAVFIWGIKSYRF